jgi:hypothetical protein
MKKDNHNEPILNSLARKLGHVAGSVAKATQDFSANPSTEKVPVSKAKQSKSVKRATQPSSQQD